VPLKNLAEKFGDNRLFKVGCCGRTQNADLIIDLEDIPQAVLDLLEINCREICDGCYERLVRDRKITRGTIVPRQNP